MAISNGSNLLRWRCCLNTSTWCVPGLRAKCSSRELGSSRGVLEQVGLEGADERRVVKEAAVLLAAHQPVMDFAPTIGLGDLIANYEDFPERLTKRRAGTAE
jgi:hypothetical protein